MAMMNHAAGQARTEIGPPGTQSLESEDDNLRQNFHLNMNTLPPEDSLENHSNKSANFDEN
jgi:hypothetical protein